MKKVLSVLICALLALVVLSPLCSLICAIFGYKFTLVHPPVFAIAIFALTLLTVLISIFSRQVLENKIICIIVSALTPCALVNTGFYIRSCGNIWIIASILICAGCGYLTFRHGKPMTMKTAALVLTAGMLLPMALICFVLTVSAKTQNYEVLDTVDSPSGAYYAQIIDNDQGDKGGWKLVHIYPQMDIETPVFVIRKKPIKVFDKYYEKGEADSTTVVVQWKDDSNLVIDGNNYSF